MNIYSNLDFPPAPADRPYTFINMIATIDGKTVIGDRGDSVAGLGSSVDQELMDRIEQASDAVLLGAQTVRATGKKWNPKAPIRVAVSRSGDVPFDAQFFAAAKRMKLVQLLSAGYDRADVAAARKAGIPIANNGGANAIAVAASVIIPIRSGVIGWRGASAGRVAGSRVSAIASSHAPHRRRGRTPVARPVAPSHASSSATLSPSAIRPRSANSTSGLSNRCVPMTMSTFFALSSARMATCSSAD